LPVLLMLPWRRLLPDECSVGVTPTQAINCRGCAVNFRHIGAISFSA
jgi:hypothetical protein